jgi:hypothetical protein
VAVDRHTGQLLGTVVTPRPGGHVSELGRPGELDFRLLAVAPSARRRGIGRLLVEHSIALAAERGATRVVMNSGPDMTGAHQLYYSMGFTRLTERETRTARCPGSTPTTCSISPGALGALGRREVLVRDPVDDLNGRHAADEQRPVGRFLGVDGQRDLGPGSQGTDLGCSGCRADDDPAVAPQEPHRDDPRETVQTRIAHPGQRLMLQQLHRGRIVEVSDCGLR